MTNPIIVIGAGAAGFSAALALADNGLNVILIERNTLGSGSSSKTPGRMGHGFHYTNVETALSYLRASIKVQKKHPGFLLHQDTPNSPLRHGRYFITKDSQPGKEIILKTYEQIKLEYARLVTEDPTNEVFGKPEDFYRILDPSEYQNDVNMDIVELGIETNEHLFLWGDFLKTIREKIENHPRIQLMENTEVEQLSRSDEGRDRFKVSTLTKDGSRQTLDTHYVINSTWENIEKLNAQLNISMPSNFRTNRLKTLLVVKLPEELTNKNSMFFCMGQHGMMSNIGNGYAMMTYAKVTNIETSTGLDLSDDAKRLLQDGPTSDEINYYGKQMIDGISHYIPDMKKCEIIDLKFGIVQTLGELRLEQLHDSEHVFNKRSDHNVRMEERGFLSNPCMKLFYFEDNGDIVLEMMSRLMITDEIIDRIILNYKNNPTTEFNGKIERTLRRKLEQLPSNVLIEQNIEEITSGLINNEGLITSRFRLFETHENQNPTLGVSSTVTRTPE